MTTLQNKFIKNSKIPANHTTFYTPNQTCSGTDIRTLTHPCSESMSNTRIWREFTAGMSMFKQGMTRINANLIDIARSNLHLLHKDLLCFGDYLKLINDTKSRGEITWVTVATGINLNCSLLTIPPNQIETIPETITRLLGVSDDITPYKCILMLYVVTGKVTVQYKKQSKTTLFGSISAEITSQLLTPSQACMQSLNKTIDFLHTHEETSQILIVVATAAKKPFHSHF